MIKKLMLLTGICCCIGILLSGCGQVKDTADLKTAYEVTDIQGTVVKMPDKPKRIITLSMSTDEVMLGLVSIDRMAGVNAMLDDPISSNIVEIANRIPTKIRNPSVEEIFAMKPDLVIVPDWGNLERVASLRDLGLKVVVCKGPRSLNDIRATIMLLAQAAGEPANGEILLSKMDAKMAEIKAKVDKLPTDKRPKVVLISLMRSYGGSGCSFDEACQYAGVINGMADIGIRTGQAMTKEQLVQINPDIMFLPTYNNHGKYDINKFRSEYLDDPSLQTIKAVKNKQLKEPREGYIYNCSQDFVFTIQEIAYTVYGDEFKQPADCHLSALD